MTFETKLFLIVLGLVAIIAGLIYFSLHCNKQSISIVAFILAILLMLFTTTLCRTYNNEKAWNDGYCECGTHWELVSTARKKSSMSIIKYYICPDCYNEIEINE